MPARSKSRAGGSQIAVVIITLAVALLITVLLIQRHSLSDKIVKYNDEIEILQDQIDAEKERSLELEKLPAYVDSYEYIEKVAREKFGLVYEDEILFKAADE